MRVLIGHVLTRADIEAIEAEDGPSTLAAWREHRPDVIVLDHKMPPTSGFDIAAQILSEDPNQLIFMFSALVDEGIRARTEQMGITLCLSKDRVFDIPDLVRQFVNRA